MVGWLNGHGFGWTLGVGDGQGGLACCSSWGPNELDMTERLNSTELNQIFKKVTSVRFCGHHPFTLKFVVIWLLHLKHPVFIPFFILSNLFFLLAHQQILSSILIVISE